MGVNSARENLAMPFMQWALGASIPWFEITEVLSPLWNKIDRGVTLESSLYNVPVRMQTTPRFVVNGRGYRTSRLNIQYCIIAQLAYTVGWNTKNTIKVWRNHDKQKFRKQVDGHCFNWLDC